MTNYVRRLLIHCEEAGHTMVCRYDGCEPDYEGTSAALAEEAIVACDEMHLFIYDRDRKKVGWVMIINDLEPDERIADCSGARLEAWMKENIPNE